eukprot:3741809-Prymnesium_polylepis.2
MPGRKRGAAKGRVATPRGEEVRKREPRGAGGRSAGGNSEPLAGGEVTARPGKFDIVLVENEMDCASHTKSGGKWLGGLFAKRALEPGDVIA